MTTPRFRTLSYIAMGLVAACAPAKFENKPDPACSVNCIVTPDGTKYVDYDESVQVESSNKKVDIIVVDDNSRSMQIEQSNMASKFPTFIDQLNNANGGAMDWQLAIITTDMDSSSAANKGGNLVEFKGASNTYVINRATPNVNQLFSDTIQMTVDANTYGSGDERGIYSTLTAVNKNQSGWIRPDAALAVVVLSDEDERSNTGQFQGYALEQGKDYPADLMNAVKAKFGANKKLTVHSIIIPPNDSGCLNAQRAQNTGGGTGYYGTLYRDLTELTGGVLGSVCADDYGSQLSAIGNNITTVSMSSTPLKCAPVDGNVQITFPGPAPASTSTVNGDKLVFDPPLPEGTRFQIKYRCKL